MSPPRRISQTAYLRLHPFGDRRAARHLVWNPIRDERERSLPLDHPIDEPRSADAFPFPVSFASPPVRRSTERTDRGGPTHIFGRIGWPREGLWLPLDKTFAGWTVSLTTGDDETLRRVGLPPSTALEADGQRGRFGVVIGSARVGDLPCCSRTLSCRPSCGHLLILPSGGRTYSRRHLERLFTRNNGSLHRMFTATTTHVWT